MSNGLFGPGVGVYRPGNKVFPPNWTYEARPPTANDNQGYVIGDLWLDTSGTPEPEPWVLVSLAGNSTSSGSLAHWILFAGPDVDVQTLTGNTGGPVPPTANNINVVGDNVTIAIAGNPGTSTLTVSAVGTGLISTLTGDDNNPVSPIAGNIDVLGTPLAGATVAFNQGGPAILELLTTDGNLNTIIGNSAGGPAGQITTATANSALGYESLNALVDGVRNSALGVQSLFTLDSGSNNVAAGYKSMELATNASRNVSLGSESLAVLTNGLENVTAGYQAMVASTASDESVIVGAKGGLYITTGDNNVGLGWSVYADPIGLAGITTGSNNVAIGVNAAGSALRTTDSSNILLGSIGVVGDNNTIRIGSQGAGAGQQNAAYMAGVYQAAVGGTNEMVVVDNTGKLGSVPVSPLGTVSFYAYNNADVANYFNIGGSIRIQFPATLFNVGAAYNTGTYVFTAPTTGYYLFQMGVSFLNVPATITEYALVLTTTTNNYLYSNGNPATMVDPGNPGGGMNQTVYAFMTAGDTATVDMIMNGSAGNCTLGGQGGASGTQFRTIFSGTLLNT